MFLGDLFIFVSNVMNRHLTYLGFTFTLWDVFVLTIVFSILGWVLGRIMNIWSN